MRVTDDLEQFKPQIQTTDSKLTQNFDSGDINNVSLNKLNIRLSYTNGINYKKCKYFKTSK